MWIMRHKLHDNLLWLQNANGVIKGKNWLDLKVKAGSSQGAQQVGFYIFITMKLYNDWDIHVVNHQCSVWFRTMAGIMVMQYRGACS